MIRIERHPAGEAWQRHPAHVHDRVDSILEEFDVHVRVGPLLAAGPLDDSIWFAGGFPRQLNRAFDLQYPH